MYLLVCFCYLFLYFRPSLFDVALAQDVANTGAHVSASAAFAVAVGELKRTAGSVRFESKLRINHRKLKGPSE